VIGVATEERELVVYDGDGVSGAGPSQAARAPSGGSEPHEVGSVGAPVHMPMNVLLASRPRCTAM